MMIRVVLTIAIGFSGLFIATAINQPATPTAQPAIAPATVTPCNCPGVNPP